jgi:CDP-glucose 4,6-dehydratase
MNPILFPRINALKGPILVTGHTGFKGAWLTLMLEHLGHRVIGIAREPEENSLFSKMNRAGSIEEIFADLQDQDKITNFVNTHKPSIVFHLAAQSLVAESYREPIQTFSTNVMGTASILEACCNVDSVQVVLVATTDKVYENNDSGRKFVESDPLGGKDPYSASKVGTEMVVKAWRSVQSTGRQPKIIVARAGNVIGGGDYAENRIFPDLIRSIRSNKPIEIRNPHSTRPWQHVLDPLHGYIRFAEECLGGLETNTLNFGPDGDDITVAQLISIAEENLPVQRLKDNNEKVSFNEAKHLSLDSSCAKRELSWTPRYSQVEAIHSTAKWWARYLSGEESASALCMSEIEQFIAR